MKYFARQFLTSNLSENKENPEEYSDIAWKDCSNAEEATSFVKEILDKGYELKLKRQKRDYDKVLHVELYFAKK